MILLFFSQMAALESAGFESMHGYSEVCILSIKLCRLTISATSIINVFLVQLIIAGAQWILCAVVLSCLLQEFEVKGELVRNICWDRYQTSPAFA